MRLLFLLLVGVCVALLWLGRYLPMNDAPSHIANSVVAQGLWRGDPFFREHYTYSLSPVPYWGTTLGMLALMPLCGALRAFQVLLAGYVALLPLAFYYLVRTVRPDDEPAPQAMIAALSAFHWAYWMGESNYLLGQPLIFLGYALFLRTTRLRSGAFAAFVAVAVLTYLCHVYALTALLIAVHSYLLLALVGRLAPGLRARLGRAGFERLDRFPLRAPQVVAGGLLIGLLGLGLYFVFVHHGTDSNHGTLAFDLSPRRLLHMAIDPFDSPLSPSRAVIFAGLGLCLLGLFVPYLGQGRALAAGLSLPLLLPALGLLGAAVLGPVEIRNPDGSVKESEIAIRFVLSGFLLALAALRPRNATGRGLLLGGALLLCVLKLPDAYRLHRDVNQAVTAVSTELLAKVPPQSKLLPLMDMTTDRWRDFLTHRIGNYVVVERHGYSPHIFATIGQQNLRHRRWGDQRPVSDLHVRDEEWAFYDYLLIQTDRPLASTPSTKSSTKSSIDQLTERAALIGAAADFRLYRVKKL